MEKIATPFRTAIDAIHLMVILAITLYGYQINVDVVPSNSCNNEPRGNIRASNGIDEEFATSLLSPIGMEFQDADR